MLAYVGFFFFFDTNYTRGKNLFILAFHVEIGKRKRKYKDLKMLVSLSAKDADVG